MVVAIDRIGRTWYDTIRAIASLQERGVKVKSLSPSEAEWSRYLEAEQDSPDAFIGHILLMFGHGWPTRSWSPSGSGARPALSVPGKRIGRSRALTPDQVKLVRRQREAGMTYPKLAEVLEVSESTVKRAVRGRR